MNNDLQILRHTASHVLAQAVKRLFPETKLAIGPAIDTGFYYDFDVEKPFTDEDKEKLLKNKEEITLPIPLLNRKNNEYYDNVKIEDIESAISDADYNVGLLNELKHIPTTVAGYSMDQVSDDTWSFKNIWQCPNVLNELNKQFEFLYEDLDDGYLLISDKLFDDVDNLLKDYDIPVVLKQRGKALVGNVYKGV